MSCPTRDTSPRDFSIMTLHRTIHKIIFFLHENLGEKSKLIYLYENVFIPSKSHWAIGLLSKDIFSTFSVLAIFDSLFVFVQVINIGFVETLSSNELNKFLTKVAPLLGPMQAFFYTCSVYMTVLLTVVRYIAVCHLMPSKIHLITRRKIKAYIGIGGFHQHLLVFLFVYQFQSGKEALVCLSFAND